MLSYDLKLQKLDSIEILISPKLMSERSILVLFTTRQGGVSLSPYDSLNLAFHVGDKVENVVKNRAKLCSCLGIKLERLTTAQQVHRDGVVIVDEQLVGSGSKSYLTAIPETDALITDLFNVPLAVFLADCLPVVLVDPVQRVIAVVHAGWKGIEQQIIIRVARMLKKKFGTQGSKVLAFIGPTIGSCCYNVDFKRARIFNKFPGAVMKEKGDYYLDLTTLARQQLFNSGLLAKHIFEASMCTSCLEGRFFSYRRRAITGRQAALAMIC